VVAVGSTPAGNGKWGHADLAGNALECTLDCYGAYPVSAIANYANISGGPNRVYRGGDFPGNAGGLCAAYRGNGTPGDHSFVTGVRCARTAQ
jgi:formylglycine-generating enzyme required for sulfatase activity